MKLIHDITQDDESRLEVPSYLRGYGQRSKARSLKTEVMVGELYRRGVTIEDIFGMYYSIEANSEAKDEEIFGNDEDGQHGRVLKVGDVELAGLAKLPKQTINRQPF